MPEFSPEQNAVIREQIALATAYQMLMEASRKHFDGDLRGKLIVDGGMGMLGGVLAAAASMHGAAFLGIEANPEQIKRCVKSGYCDAMVNDLDEALRILKNAVRKREAASVGLTGNCADILPLLARRGVVPDFYIDQIGGIDSGAYIPRGLSTAQMEEVRKRDAEEYRRKAAPSVVAQIEGIVALQKLGMIAAESGNGLREVGARERVADTEQIHDANAECVAPLRANGFALFFCVALSGQPADIRRVDALALALFPADENLSHWIRHVQKRVRLQDPPTRAYWLQQDQERRLGEEINEFVARTELKGALVVGVVRENSGVFSGSVVADGS